MRSSLSVLWRMVLFSFQGSVSRANGWGAIVGATTLYVAVRLGLIKNMIIPDGIYGQLLVAVFCAGAAWIVIIFARLIYAPIYLVKQRDILIHARDQEIAGLQADKLELQIVDHSIRYKPPEFSFSGDPLSLIIKVRNPGSPTIVTNWKLHVLDPSGQAVREMRVGAAAWGVYKRIGQSDVRIDISREPLAAGAEATATLLVFPADITPPFVSGRQFFRVECEDVKRRQSTADYVADFDPIGS